MALAAHVLEQWVILLPSIRRASKRHLMNLADIIGFHYVRTSMPEYIRIIERGTMRTFGKDVVGVSSFFSGSFRSSCISSGARRQYVLHCELYGENLRQNSQILKNTTKRQWWLGRCRCVMTE